MKNILCGTVAALALVAAAAPAAAQTSERHYSTPTLDLPFGLGTIGGDFENPSNTPIIFGISPQDVADAAVEGTFLTPSVGTRYTAEASAQPDSDPATRRVNVVFRLSVSVNKDCSFYSGNNDAARDIDFGVIGVRTGNNENVNRAFEMVGPATAAIETLTAGCNFNNEVSITKSDVDGLINNNPGGYDSDEFQANIPYSVEAKWTGVGVGVVDSGTLQTLAVSEDDTDGLGALQQGAWRSSMTIDIVAPAITSKGLVAGNYRGSTRLTLRAL